MKKLNSLRKQIMERYVGLSLPRVGIAQGQKAVDDIDAKVLANLDIPENRQRLNMFIANILAKDYVNPWTPIKTIQQKLELVGLTLKLPPSTDSFPEAGTIEYYPIYSFGGKIGMDPYVGWTDETRGTNVPFELRVSFEFESGHWIVDAEIVTESEAEDEFESAEDEDDDFLDEDCGCDHKKKVNAEERYKKLAKRRGETIEELDAKVYAALGVSEECTCWKGYERVPGTKPCEKKSCRKKKSQESVKESAPDNPKIEKWIKANKGRFQKEYGKKKGLATLYAKAWKMHNQSIQESHGEIGVVKDILKFMENDKDFYTDVFLPCIKDLATKIAQNKYSEKIAKNKFSTLITKAVSAYNEDTDESKITLKLSDKNKILESLMSHFEEDVNKGLYDEILDDKYEGMSLKGKLN